MADILGTVNCKQCGGPLKIKPGDVLISCEYCGNTQYIAVDKPFVFSHSIIPAKVTEDNFQKTLEAWMRRGFLKPKDLAKKHKLIEASLEYYPFWIFQVKAKSKIKGLFERTGKETVIDTEIEKEYFWKVLSTMTGRFPTKEYEIPLSAKAPFRTDLVGKGGRVINSEIDEEDARKIARQEIEAHHKQLAAQNVDRVASIDTEFEFGESEYLHAPVWFVRYEYKKKEYDLVLDAISAETVTADIPESRGFFF